MSKKGSVLIRHQEGNQRQCHMCEKRTAYVVHYDYDDLPEGRVASERFLCKEHWQTEWYNNPAKYDPDNNNGTFTSMYIREWMKRQWKEYMSEE